LYETDNHRVEQGKYLPSLELALRIARTFGVPVEDVFEYRTADDSN